MRAISQYSHHRVSTTSILRHLDILDIEVQDASGWGLSFISPLDQSSPSSLTPQTANASTVARLHQTESIFSQILWRFLLD